MVHRPFAGGLRHNPAARAGISVPLATSAAKTPIGFFTAAATEAASATLVDACGGLAANATAAAR